MTWRNALAFRQVAEQRSFVKAAAAAGVSQPALSKRVAQLERQLNAQLLLRTTRRVQLTGAGEVLLETVREMAGCWSTAVRSLASPERSPPPADPMAMIDFEEARTLLAVAVDGTLRPAAERLHTSPRTVSQRIRRLEQVLDVPLFLRHAGGLAPTPAGSTVRSAVEQMMTLWERGTAAVGSLPVASSRLEAELPDVVRLSSYSLAVDALLEHFVTRWPHVSWSSVAFNPSRSLRDLRAGNLDLLIGFETDRTAPTSEPYRFPLLREPVWLAIDPDHPLAGNDSLHLADLADEPWILWPDGPLRDLAVRACRAAGFTPRVQHTTADVTAIVSLVSAGRGVTFAAATGRRHEGILLRPVIGMPYRDLYLAWNHRTISTPAARLCRRAALDFYCDRARTGNPDYWAYIRDHPEEFPALVPQSA